MPYTTPSKVRARLGGCTGWDDLKIAPYIARASAFIDAVTGWWFEPRDQVLQIDGHGDSVLLLPVPICEITKIEIMDYPTAPPSASEVSLDVVAIYNRHLTQRLSNPDDRKNPKIAFVGIYAGAQLQEIDVWPSGHQNIKITGTFGFTDWDAVEAHGVVPALIQDVCERLVIRDLPPDPSAGSASPTDPAWYEAWMRSQGRVTKEKVRDQEIDYAPAGAVDGNQSGVITGDPMIDMILLMHMKPIAMRTV